MHRALELARPHFPHPNPRVGAVVLNDQGVVNGEGAHVGSGHPHAESLAITQAGPRAQNSTLVVTLEPCRHWGKTPPCTEQIISAGVRRVVIGIQDPDSRNAGKGIERLQEAGIETITGVEEELCEQLDPAYLFHRRRGRARVTLKMALTLDGEVAAQDGTSQWITGPTAREDAHLLRAESDAIMIGAGTLRQDNPRLTVRLPHRLRRPSTKNLTSHLRSPTPVVIMGKRNLFPAPSRTPDMTSNPSCPPIQNSPLGENPETVWVSTEPIEVCSKNLVAPCDQRGWPDLEFVLTKLGEQGMLDILCEGGPTLAASLWERGLVDRGVWYLGAVLAGGTGSGPFHGQWKTHHQLQQIEITAVSQLGPDVRVDWLPSSLTEEQEVK